MTVNPSPIKPFIFAGRAAFLAIHLFPLATLIFVSAEHSIRGKGIAVLLLFSTLPFYWLRRGPGPMHVSRRKLRDLWFLLAAILFVLAVSGIWPAFAASEELQILISAPTSYIFGLPADFPEKVSDMQSRASLGLIVFDLCFYLQWFLLVPWLFAKPRSEAGGRAEDLKGSVPSAPSKKPDNA